MTATMHPLVSLAHQFTVNFFNGHDVSVCTQIMAPDYSLRLGDYVIAGRDAQYMPALQQQFEQFPGIVMTAHKVITNGDKIALQVTESGASGGPGGRVACWTAIALYRWDGSQLTSCLAQEDYASRRRQLKSGIVDPIDSPTPAPWDTVPIDSDPSAEAIVSAWLTTSAWMTTPGLRIDDENRETEDRNTNERLVFEVHSTEIAELFSAGADVAFHVCHHGKYISGFSDLPVPDTHSTQVLYSAGMVTVADGRVVSGRIIRDRLALRALLVEEDGGRP